MRPASNKNPLNPIYLRNAISASRKSPGCGVNGQAQTILTRQPAQQERVELVPDALPRAMRSVLVYDPIGTKLDLPSSAPSRDRR